MLDFEGALMECEDIRGGFEFGDGNEANLLPLSISLCHDVLKGRIMANGPVDCLLQSRLFWRLVPDSLPTLWLCSRPLASRFPAETCGPFPQVFQLPDGELLSV